MGEGELAYITDRDAYPKPKFHNPPKIQSSKFQASKNKLTAQSCLGNSNFGTFLLQFKRTESECARLNRFISFKISWCFLMTKQNRKIFCDIQK